MPTDITVLDLSAYVGLTAVGFVTLNMLLGTLMAFRYSPVRQWPHRRLNYFRLHHLSGYVALSLAVLHPIVLLFDKTAKFRVLDLLYPFHSPSQPLENTIGAVALYDRSPARSSHDAPNQLSGSSVVSRSRSL